MAIIKQAKNMNITVKGTYTVIAGSITEIADKITITATTGNLTLSSNKKVVIQGMNGGVVYNNYTPTSNEKKITDVIWMDSNLEHKINSAHIGDKVSLVLQTKNYNNGETITLKMREKNEREIKTGKVEIIFTGVVNENGFAELKGVVEIEETEKNQ
ncbi:hypothetical protein ACM39_11595 [Chryseobacterium sp. FH2]|uniref:hypothetical protein n=1 Tax=Chryseobacterium sp. FH2 TaxID=1674291 RepID=UPI00065A9C3D|nr:hypothetical protein [Chryseobacterium sp. FH2]KMQ67968.1 hypothetical protein ACM39_11595 [Chryseobacterium sp. FH2]